MGREFSPEERLLRLIKGKRENTFPPEDLVRPDQKREEQPAEDKAVHEGEIPVRKESTPGQPKQKIVRRASAPTRLPLLYLVSGAIVILLCMIFLYMGISSREKQELKNLDRMIASITEEAGKAPLTTPEKKEAKLKEEPTAEDKAAKPETSFEEYQKLLKEKSIFSPPVKDKGEAVTAGPTLRELIKDVRLVGIMPGDEPQAIIEDKKSGQTLFLKRYERIDGIEIKDISDGRVVLGYGEETITLSL